VALNKPASVNRRALFSASSTSKLDARPMPNGPMADIMRAAYIAALIAACTDLPDARTTSPGDRQVNTPSATCAKCAFAAWWPIPRTTVAVVR
jgi:hypothetical protein